MRRLILLIILFYFGLAGFSQSKDYQFIHLSTAEGLSQSSAIAIHQDNLGQIWIGTRDGLNKYDGNKFTVYRNELQNPASISNNDILSIEEDSDGYIWIGTYNGLNKYNPKTNEFKRYFHEQNNESLSNNTVWTINELLNGEIWIGTSNGLSIYNKQTDTFKTYHKNKSETSIVGNNALSILETTKGEIFIGTTTGLSKYIGKENNKLQFQTILNTNHLYIQDLVEPNNENLLIATRSQSVLEYDLNSKSLSPYLLEFNLTDDQKNVRQLLFDDKQQLWIGTYTGLRIVDANKSVTWLKSDINNSKSLSKNSIKYLYKDKKGSIWVGTYYGGVNIWDESNINFFNITRNQNQNGLSYSVVSSIERYMQFVFFGTEGGGITVMNTHNQSFQYINQSNSKQLLSDNIKSLFVSNNDKLWIGTFNRGVLIYNLKLKKFEENFLPNALRNYLKDVGIYTIRQDEKSNIWLGTFGKGIVKFNLNSKTFETIIYSNDTSKSLSNDLVRTLVVDQNNNIWVGTSKGLNKIDVNGVVTNYFYDINLQYGDDILSVFEDHQSDIWVGVKAKGLFKLEGSSFIPVKLFENNIAISSIHSILEDDKNQLWMSSNQGLIRYHKKSHKTEIYNQKDGVVGNEFNNNSCLKIGSSQFYFGGPLGVTSFYANNFNKNNYAPQVILTDFILKNKSVKASQENTVLKETLPYTKSVKLSYDQGNFSIAFAMPNFINSSNNSYQYRLKGLEDEWNFSSNNIASYTIQNPGNYVFQVKGANSDGVWNDTITELPIKVTPAPWRSWWAFILYGLFIATALYFLLYILKSKTKLRHQLELEYIETERTKELNKTKLEFFTNISHEFRTPLSLILGPLNQIIEDYRGSNKLYKKLLVVENSANHLLQLINRLMDFRKLENNLYKLETAEGNIVKFLREIYLSFSEFAKDGNYEYHFIAENDEILVYYDRNKLERVFYNLISNAFRYTPKGGTITIKVKQTIENVIIEVEDSGVGIAKEYQDKIFERFFEVAVNNKPDNDYSKGTGIGLSIANKIVKLHKGKIGVLSDKKELGSVFTVELPLGNSHLLDEEIIKDFKFSDDVSQYIDQLKATNIGKDVELEEIPIDDKQTILLVEDNKALRKFMRGLLKKHYNILEAENGKVAFKIAKKESPDLIVSDVVMPVMAGTELCSKIKNELKTSHIPIILLTSRTSLVYKLEGLESGADDYISKPFNINEFQIRIKNLLEATSRLKEKFSSSKELQPNEVVISSYDEKLYKRVLQIVEDNISNEEFDIPYFCSELGVSRTMLFTKIKAWSNFTPNSFIQHFRMQRAAQLLEQGKINISEVSNKVGFKNPKYFSKCFHNKFGETPTQYANKFSDY
jgi:signal transduction histidine kinase/ligand-binding sensor domain-containing protein/DNA-binding response OmpR family regulator